MSEQPEADWKPTGNVWRGWWDLPGWFALIRDFGFRGALHNIRWAKHMRDWNRRR